MSTSRALTSAGVCCALALSCKPPDKPATRPAPGPQPFALFDLLGDWRWLLRTSADGTTRIEDEQWKLRRDAPGRLSGRYIRSVEIRSDAGATFRCNQRPWYRQRAVFDVAIEMTGPNAFAVTETGYRTEPSPCDHGFRTLGAYTGKLVGDRLQLAFEGGTQTLWKIGDATTELPEDPWPASPTITGPWRWDARSYDGQNNIRDEHEWWEITRRSDTRIDVTYRRKVTVTSGDGDPIACANGTSWSYDDAYVLDGQREEEHWHFYEVAARPGEHPCLKATPTRRLDEATGEQLGDYLVLEWRGKRHQVLYRPD